MAKAKDPYIRYTKDIKPRIGFTALDEAQHTPGPSLPRTWERVQDTEERKFTRNPETILCPGAALGIDEAGTVHHFRAGLKWLGFLIGNGSDELAVKVRGAISLKIDGATDQDRGKPIYCIGPDTFSLDAIGPEIGKVRYCQAGRCAVAFRREGDQKPLDLRIDIH